MFQQWLEQLTKELGEIGESYPHAPEPDRSRLKEEFKEIQLICENVLEGWITLEEQMALMAKKYPELATESAQEDIGEEFWLEGHVVRSFRQGQGYYQLKMFGEAKPYFNRVVQEAPDFLLGRVYLALSYFQQQNWEEASKEFYLVTKTAEHSRFVSFAYHMLGCIHVQKGEDELAVRQFTRSLDIHEEGKDTWFNLGACYYRLRNYPEAIPQFFQSLRLDPDDWESMYYLSCCYKEVEQWESVRFWRSAVYKKTNHPIVMESIAKDFEDTGDVEGALRWYQKLMIADPKRASAYHGVSWNKWASGDHDGALLLLQKGLTLEPHNKEYLFTYVWYLLQQGELKKVEKVLQRLSDEMLSHPQWLILRSRWHVHCGDFTNAKATARQVVDSQDPYTCSLGYYQLGRVLLEQEDVKEAAKHFHTALQLFPQWKEPLFYQGLCYLLDGEIEGTRQCWEQLPMIISSD
ncbi:tetratricopeptide repeat protein [Marininema halotolerans]|uniref:Tetratricopeptide repeat-containing protein n=1 Tax=Marininema halotolerans TaxID=1155944 RepID=A0A1I6U134_9BACL|nr:tetratricopeptide repeat protein [Marininema halotolerans]SFS95104.1 Tetratricopeptide repeat-containing protein [Marininema halotolerans]